ncbi:MAG: DUF1203 domain-containing protein [Candidatus Marinimicrobia bacterium]|jgi:hypothetical protein|nr:DUF1203 domain-containing protein [Candidatus Neomarinimicrobiota bacterium]MBT3632848.1 DUF1203 domain-containing protein [Candidatus Neomarinimicrobiota bacterium]MBT3681958.1 DUF1203 domain-containing protein [Candidatus Neomarinimicrobiota bacterium]MBT3759013.1 DUF1203 domain-containing protein [Candidatus Neomarinimicrobiota bacterium]MBT3895088.1 DUF1203 domain-containing protein [Candidatus Neomarinimicrobiota bacterium]
MANTHTNFKITPLEKNRFINLFKLKKSELEKIGALKMIVDSYPGVPCRVSLEDAKIGEEVILVPYQHHKTKSPYQSKGPIFIRKEAETAKLEINEIPKMLNHRLLSLRGFDNSGILKKAIVTEGNILREKILAFFEYLEIQYIHVHNAGPGCYNCTIERA